VFPKTSAKLQKRTNLSKGAASSFSVETLKKRKSTPFINNCRPALKQKSEYIFLNLRFEKCIEIF
jgi:hypothetical protein